jgi:hypothetical protein
MATINNTMLKNLRILCSGILMAHLDVKKLPIIKARAKTMANFKFTNPAL